MGFFSTLFGKDAANAATRASQDTYAKLVAAANDLKDYGNTYADEFRQLYQPYADTGLQGNEALQRLLADPSAVRSLPGYQFTLDEGVNALDRSAAARGMLNSGRQSKDLLRFGQGLADRSYGDWLSRLMSVSNQGMNATAGIGQGLAGQLGTRQTAYTGQVAAAPVIGQGMIGAAQAQSSALGNLLNLGGYLGGKVLGGGIKFG